MAPVPPTAEESSGPFSALARLPEPQSPETEVEDTSAGRASKLGPRSPKEEGVLESPLPALLATPEAELSGLCSSGALLPKGGPSSSLELELPAADSVRRCSGL